MYPSRGPFRAFVHPWGTGAPATSPPALFSSPLVWAKEIWTALYLTAYSLSEASLWQGGFCRVDNCIPGRRHDTYYGFTGSRKNSPSWMYKIHFKVHSPLPKSQLRSACFCHSPSLSTLPALLLGAFGSWGCKRVFKGADRSDSNAVVWAFIFYASPDAFFFFFFFRKAKAH